MLSKLGRWTTIAAVAVGYALVHGFTFGFLVSTYMELGRNRVFQQPHVQRVEISREGQLRYVRVNDEFALVYTTPAGEVLPSVPGPEMLTIVREQYSSSPNRGHWSDRIATFETVSDRDVVWTLVAERESRLAQVYFTAVQRSSRKTLGYLGRNGFQATIPNASELIDWDIQSVNMYNLANWLNIYRTSTPPNFSQYVGGTPTVSFDRWPIISQGKLVAIDFATRSIAEHPEFGECQSITWMSSPQIVQVAGRFSPAIIPVLVQKDKLIFDPLGTPHAVVLPERLRTQNFELYLPVAGEPGMPEKSPMTAIEGQFLRQRKIHITRFSAAGQVISEEDHQLPELPYQHLMEHNSRERIVLGSLAIPVPIIWLVVAFWEPSWSLPIAGFSIALGLACLMAVSRWKKNPWTWGHAVAALIFGPAAAMTLWAMLRSRPSEELEPAPLNGCEVFG